MNNSSFESSFIKGRLELILASKTCGSCKKKPYEDSFISEFKLVDSDCVFRVKKKEVCYCTKGNWTVCIRCDTATINGKKKLKSEMHLNDCLKQNSSRSEQEQCPPLAPKQVGGDSDDESDHESPIEFHLDSNVESNGFDDAQPFDADDAMGDDETASLFEKRLLSPVEFFESVSEEEWPDKSKNYYKVKARYPGSDMGRKFIVAKALSTGGSAIDYKDITDKEVDYQFNTIKTHMNVTTISSERICLLMKAAYEECNQRCKKEKELSLEESRGVLESALRNEGIEDDAIKRIQNDFFAKMKCRHRAPKQRFDMPICPSHPEVRAIYLSEGKSSMLNLIPGPISKMVKHSSPDNNELVEHPEDTSNEHSDSIYLYDSRNETREFAYINPGQIINHLLASGPPMRYFRAGHSEDWYYDAQKKSYESRFIQQLHQKINDMLAEGTINKETIIILIRTWSDGYQNKQIAGNSAFNNYQAHTVTILPEKHHKLGDCTLPASLTFKKSDHHDVETLLLKDCRRLQEPSLRYLGHQNKISEVCCFAANIVGDLPERCSNCSLRESSAKGRSFHRRFGVSSDWNSDHTPSCMNCELRRIEIVLNGNYSVSLENCNRCSDWQSQVIRDADVYPIAPGDHLDSSIAIPTVRLSFKLLRNSLNLFGDWYRANNPTQAEAKQYLSLLCISAKVCNKLVLELRDDGVPIEDCRSYPVLFKEYENLGIELYQYATTPMHLLFLGIMKSLLEEAPRLFNRQKKNQREAWRALVKYMKMCFEQLSNVGIDWCHVMKFSGDATDGIGTASWVSKHFVSFVRFSLYYFGYLGELIEPFDLPEEVIRSVKCFQRMILAFVMLIAHTYNDDFIPSCKIDTKTEHLVRLFLSSCRFFDDSCPKKKKKKQKKKQRRERIHKIRSLRISGNVKRLLKMSTSLQATNPP